MSKAPQKTSSTIKYLLCISLVYVVMVAILFSTLDIKDSLGAFSTTLDTETRTEQVSLLVVIPFHGLSRDVSLPRQQQQKFVINAWVQLAKEVVAGTLSPQTSIRVIGMVENVKSCYSEFETSFYTSHYACRPTLLKCLHSEFRIPTMDCIFKEAVNLARPSEALLYVNSDIVFSLEGIQALQSIISTFRTNNQSDFVITGRRTEVQQEIVPPNYSIHSHKWLIQHALQQGVTYSPYGLDYFVFPPSVVPEDFPRFLVGRWRWDNAFLAHFIINDVPTVDASETVLAIHIGVTTDFTPLQYNRRNGADYNDRLVRDRWGDAFYIGRTDNARFVHRKASYELQSRADHADPTQVVLLRRSLQVQGRDHFNPIVHLLVVCPGQWRHALKIGCVLSNDNKVSSHYTFLTMDVESYMQVRAVYPEAVIMEKAKSSSQSDCERVVHMTIAKLLRDKATIVISDVSQPIWSVAHVDDAELSSQLRKQLILKCDMTMHHGRLLSIRPSAGGFHLFRRIQDCNDVSARQQLVQSAKALTKAKRDELVSSYNACLQALQDSALLSDDNGKMQPRVCQLDRYLPAPQLLPEAIVQGRTWFWDAGKKQCQGVLREEDSKKNARTASGHPAAAPPKLGAGPSARQLAIRRALRTVQPVDKVLHAVVVVDSPCGIASRYDLAREMVARLERDDADHVLVYLVELAYGGQPFRVTRKRHPRHLQLRTEMAMWHKENLINLAVERLLPSDWRAMAWIDGDVDFDSPSWASDTLKLLNSGLDVVQLFSHAMFMNAGGSTIRTYSGFAYNFVQGRTFEGSGPDFWHPGFGWAYTRRAYEQAGGMFELEISGHGDGIIARCMVGGYDWANYWTPFSSEGHRDAVLAYNSSCAGLRMGYTPGVLRHYYHGAIENRKYVVRRQIYNDFGFDPLRHLRRDEATGVLVPTKGFPSGLAEAMDVQVDCQNIHTDNGDITVFAL